MDINADLIIDKLQKLVSIKSPGGYTENALNYLREEFNELGLTTSLTKKGALIATLEGYDDESQVTISAHIDTLGGMVKEINSDGTLRFHKIGGGTYNSLEGENCTIINRYNQTFRGSCMPKKASTHIYGAEIVSSKRDEFSTIIRLDEKVSNSSDILELGINVGDFIAFEPRFEFTKSGFIKSRYLDNKAAISIILEVLRLFKTYSIKPKHTTNFIISNFEEQGHGLSFIPPKTEELLALDIGTVGEYQTSSEFKVTIAAKDRRSVYDFNFRKKLQDICISEDIDYAIDLFNAYSSDATQAISRGFDSRFALIGPGVSATHHYERTHIDSLINTANLIYHYLAPKKD